jgi:hypothetical protein
MRRDLFPSSRCTALVPTDIDRTHSRKRVGELWSTSLQRRYTNDYEVPCVIPAASFVLCHYYIHYLEPFRRGG